MRIAIVVFILLSAFIGGAVKGYIDEHPIEQTAVLIRARNGHGSGVYIGNGKVITAAHVAKEAEDDGKMDVELGDVSVPGTVKWFDEASDVGLITLDKPIAGVKAARLSCTSKDMTVGDPVEVIGFPLILGQTHTWGRVSRNIGKDFGHRYIWIDATIASGNSGGPVFTTWDRRLAGIISAVAVDTLQGIFPTIVAFGAVVPRSVICEQLSKKHPAPTFDTPTS